MILSSFTLWVFSSGFNKLATSFNLIWVVLSVTLGITSVNDFLINENCSLTNSLNLTVLVTLLMYSFNTDFWESDKILYLLLL